MKRIQKIFLPLTLLFTLFGLGSCMSTFQGGVRGLYTPGQYGGEAVIAYDSAGADPKKLNDQNVNGRDQFLSFGTELSLGGLYTPDKSDGNITGGGIVYVGYNDYGVKQVDKVTQALGLRIQAGIGSRVFQSEAHLVFQGSVQVLYTEAVSKGGLSVEIMGGYMPDIRESFFGIGISINNMWMMHGSGPSLGWQ